MGEQTRDDAPGKEERSSSALKQSATLAAVKPYWKLALGMLLVALLVVFVVQNADATHVKFMVWETDLSQALVVFLSAATGMAFGVAFNGWRRWRSSQV